MNNKTSPPTWRTVSIVSNIVEAYGGLTKVGHRIYRQDKFFVFHFNPIQCTRSEVALIFDRYTATYELAIGTSSSVTATVVDTVGDLMAARDDIKRQRGALGFRYNIVNGLTEFFGTDPDRKISEVISETVTMLESELIYRNSITGTIDNSYTICINPPGAITNTVAYNALNSINLITSTAEQPINEELSTSNYIISGNVDLVNDDLYLKSAYNVRTLTCGVVHTGGGTTPILMMYGMHTLQRMVGIRNAYRARMSMEAELAEAEVIRLRPWYKKALSALNRMASSSLEWLGIITKC